MKMSDEQIEMESYEIENERLRNDLIEMCAALDDVTDGNQWHDIQYNTALPEERCKNIMLSASKARAILKREANK